MKTCRLSNEEPDLWSVLQGLRLLFTGKPQPWKMTESTSQFQEWVKNARGVKTVHFRELTGKCLPSKALLHPDSYTSVLPCQSFTSHGKSALLEPKWHKLIREGKPDHTALAAQGKVLLCYLVVPLNKMLAWSFEASLLHGNKADLQHHAYRAWQHWGQPRALLMKKNLTNILPRFNVHLFLTRGTYSIKISYWINDIH